MDKHEYELIHRHEVQRGEHAESNFTCLRCFDQGGHYDYWGNWVDCEDCRIYKTLSECMTCSGNGVIDGVECPICSRL